MQEEWKIINLDPKYSVSNLGRVKTISNGLIHKPAPDLDGYLTVRLSGKTFRIHRLVALVFIGEKPNGKNIGHKDGNNQNNQVDNLGYYTQKENISHKIAHGTMANGSKNGNSRLKEDQVVQIKKMLRDNKSDSAIASKFGVVEGTIGHIRAGRTWRHI